MIMAVAVAVAAVSQAASIAWGGAISQPDGATELAANTMAYLVYSSSAITGGASFDGTNLKNGSDATIASTVSTHTITATEAAGWEFGETYAKSGSDVNGFYAVLISDMNTDPKYSIYTLNEVTGTTATSPTTNLQISWADGYLTSGGYTVTGSVPEPTSGLLLLLGMARPRLRFGCVRALREPPTSGGYGLALKRKRA